MSSHHSNPLFVIAGCLALSLAGCGPRVGGSGRVTSQTRPISGVNAVSLGGVGELTIVQSEPESLVIEAEDNILPLITTETEAGLLTISEKGNISPTKPIRFTLTVPELRKIISSGAGNIRAAKVSSPGLLDLVVEGAGAVDLSHLECSGIKLVLSGAGNVQLDGHTRNQDIEISGAANYRAGDLRTQDTKVSISGAGNAKVWAMSELNVNLSGVGNVEYFGSPTVKKEIDGIGSVHALGDKPRN